MMVSLFFMGVVGLCQAYSVNIAMYVVFRSISSLPLLSGYDAAAFLCETIN